MALRTTIVKAYEYPLTVTTLTQPQCTHLMAPVLQVGLPSSGFARNFPRAVVYGPIEDQGLGLPNIYTTQYTRHISDMVDHLWQQTPTGYFIKSNVESFKLEVGVSGPIFERTAGINWVNTSNSWVFETWKFCQQERISFNEPLPHLTLKRTQDQFLMEAFHSAGYTRPILLALNRCRLHCQVLTLADICTGDGTSLTAASLEGQKLGNRNSFVWPSQGQPPAKDWKIWKQSLQETFAPARDRLVEPLGLWMMEPLEYSTQWDWFQSADGQHLYKQMGGQWVEYQKVLNTVTRRITKFHDGTITPILVSQPDEGMAYRTTVIHSGRILVTTGYADYLQDPMSLESSDWTKEGMQQALRTLPDSRWTCWITKWPDDIAALLLDIQAGRAVAVSDGSYHPLVKLSTAAWVIQSTVTGDRMVGGGIVPGLLLDHNSYRSELGGLLGIVIFLRAVEMITRPPITPLAAALTIACDGKSALYKSLLTAKCHFSSKNKACDIISAIIDHHQKLHISLCPEHVEGHRDRQGNQLTLLEQLNVEMDDLAKRILATAVLRDEHPADTLLSRTEGLTPVFHNSAPINSCLQATLARQIASYQLRSWWIQKQRMTEEMESEIDWHVLGKVMREMPPNMKRFIPKWTTSQIAVGITMRKRNDRHKQKCPRCNYFREDTLHVLKCWDKTAIAEWTKLVNELERWLTEMLTEPALAYSLLQVLRRWQIRTHSEDFIPPQLSPHLYPAFASQARLGWRQFLEGFISIEWSRVQATYYASIGSQRTGQRWATNLSKELWKLVHGMWLHRNHALHETPAIDFLSGSDQLREAILRECRIGLDTLPPVYSPYFQTTPDILFKQPIQGQRSWFSIIRSAREASDYNYSDDFTLDPALRTWTGLPILK